MCQVMQTGIVFYFTQGYQIRNALIRCRQQFLGNVIQFAPVAFPGPMAGRLRQILSIILALIIMIIEKILAVEFNEGQRLRRQ